MIVRVKWSSLGNFDSHASYLTVPLCPGHTICQKPSRNIARIGLWGTQISGEVRGLAT